MGILKRILICMIILLFANVVLKNMLYFMGVEDRDVMPMMLWFSAIGIFIVVLPPFAGLIFKSGGKITTDIMKKSTDTYNTATNIKKVVGMV
jgi:hypothetical protein